MSTKAMSNSRFKQLPRQSHLAQFLSRHDDALRSGFITRLDRSPIHAKRLTFAKALTLNVFVLCFLSGLAATTIIRDLLSPFSLSYKLSFCLTQNMIIIAAILVLLRSTSMPFFLGECRFRICYGFRASEIVIRKPPTTAVSLNKCLPEDQRLEGYWRMATRAVNPKLLYSSTSAVFSSEYWTMEYSAVFDAMKRITEGHFEEEDMEFAIWKQDNGLWSSCELWRMHEIMTDQQEVSMFKTFLTQAGKQELLLIWQDMLSTSPSGKHVKCSSSPKAYQVMVDKFAREGLDYEDVWIQVSAKSQAIL
ncbi:hypothetical protein B0H34DRAFT_796890 [Crassisporium funariophilum]|nr:hypothetical protein B0H34DRAFT_796890 [Crassisporium funariophilum]